MPFRLVWSSCEFCASPGWRSLIDRIGFSRRTPGEPPAAPVQSGVSIDPVASAETFAFLASESLEPASLDVVDEWLAAQDQGARQGTIPAKPDSELQFFLGDESPAEEHKHKPASVATAKGDTAGPHQTRTPDDALQLWFGDAEPPSGDVDPSEKKAPSKSSKSKEESRGDTLLAKKWPVSRLVH